MKKSFLLLLCLLFLPLLVACTGNETQIDPESTAEPAPSETEAVQDTAQTEADTSQQPETLSIACSTKGYNPYLTTDTLVAQTASLLFENFIDISPDFAIDYRLAESVECSGTTVTITLRAGCYFADGTPISTDDALYSLQAAMASDTYRARFSNVLSVSATETTLVLTLATPDSMFAYLLDIPILKADDVASTSPTASGRYTYGADGTTLVKNHFTRFPSDGDDTIHLVLVANYDDMISALALGQTNYTVQGEGSTSSSSISTTEHYYKTNTLLFLGVNSYAANPLCNTAEGRNLLSALIDRDALAIDTYDARAYAARGALNSFYPAATDTQSILSTSDDSTLAQTMLTLGYTYNDESGFYQDENGTNAQISILIHTGNTYKTLLASELSEKWAKYGIETTIITASDFNSFLTLLESNEFELYIGEMKLYNNIELSSFWEGSAKHGIQASETLLSSYAAFRADASQAAAFEAAFAAEMPYIPLLWKNGVVLTSRNASGVSASISNQFYAFGDLTFSN
ncbi:MAG: ABC transporter substrate-binding protein [Faecalibacterium sp.]